MANFKMLIDKLNKSNRVLKGSVLALGLALSSWVGAHDLGVQGKVWEITEIDIRQLVMESAIRANFSQYNNQRLDSAKKYLDNLPKRVMGVSDTTETRWIDPSMEIASDIQGAGENPVTKELQWSTMFRKGTRVNPLLVYRPVTAMLFFDGSSKEQIAFVENVLREDRHGRVTLVEASGANVGTLSKAFGRPVFYANEQMIQRFSINLAPALLYPGSKEHEGLLGLTVFASPYQISDLKTAWEMDITKARGPLTGTTNATAR
jgi:hypothetical protein